MAKGANRFAKRRMRGSYLSTVIGIALVLFMLGFLGLVLLNAQQLKDYMKESIRIQVEFKDDAKDVEMSKLQKRIDASPYAKSTTFTSKAAAAAKLKEELGEDFIGFLDGLNPIPNTVELRVNAAYAHPDSLTWIEDEIQKDASVRAVEYPKDMIAKINENMRTSTLIMGGFSLGLLFIAIALINNTIRLSMYSKRFLIRSMQLVGATRGFIQRPFLYQGVVQGVLAGILAMGMLAAAIYFLRKHVPPSFGLDDLTLFGKLFGLTVLLGIFIAFISTFFAVNRYIRMKLDDLY